MFYFSGLYFWFLSIVSRTLSVALFLPLDFLIPAEFQIPVLNCICLHALEFGGPSSPFSPPTSFPSFLIVRFPFIPSLAMSFFPAFSAEGFST